MFTITLDQIATTEKLKDAAFAIRSKVVGLDKESLALYRDDADRLDTLHTELLTGRYTPEPLQRIEIAKNATESRPIALSSARDKIVQKCLAAALAAHFDKTFSDKSYGYRIGKGTLRAIHRVRDYLRRGYAHAYKTDIDDFFETIPHDRLLKRLQEEIADHRIVDLIALFLQNGAFRGFDYLDHAEGVHQGDALSPLLSNIYLDAMDRWLEERNIVFVRFADDFVLLFKKRKSLESVVANLRTFLDTMGLRLEEKKSYAANAHEGGFTFLGCRFQNDHILIDNDRLQKKVSKLYEMAKKSWPLPRYLDEINVFVEGLERYYLKIVEPRSPQFSHLEHALSDSAARRFARAFSSGELRYKKEALPLAMRIHPLTALSSADHQAFAKAIVDAAKTLAKSDPKTARSALGRKKQSYIKEMALSSALIVDSFGTSLGVAKNTITLKQKGKIVQKIPARRCERILIQTKGSGISTALIHLCAKKGIPIDFLDGASTPYAALHAIHQAYAARTVRQLAIHADPIRRLDLARAFVRAKLKNHRNYLKYLDKHHRQIEAQIETVAAMTARVKGAKSIEELMGLEGSAAAAYWEALGCIVEDKIGFPGRVTQGAIDPVNSALNYGYAILYGEVQRALVQAGVALHVSYLHALDGAKPTLVFDFIEPFRSFVVDRTIFSMVNREEPLRTDNKGLLTQKSRRLVAENVLQRLGAHTRHDGAAKRLVTVIRDEARAFARSIDEEIRYRPFIGRY
ncbi:CRISPR-associated endonuclease Cas1 [Hydrogenimonas sp.]